VIAGIRAVSHFDTVAEQKIDQPTGIRPYGSYIVTDRTCNRYEHIESVLHLAIPSSELLPKNIIDSLPNS
jgi:hypothetical protein